MAVLIISRVICSSGQSNFGVKVYQNTDFFKTRYLLFWGPNVFSEVEHVNFSRISLALGIYSKKDLNHEIEFMIPEVSRSLENLQYPMNYEIRRGTSFDSKGSSFSLRYELSKTLTKNDKRLAFSPGIGLNPYYVEIEYIPKDETTYYVSTTFYGFTVNITPRVTYMISKHFIIDLNVPFKIYDLRVEKYKVENPAIPIRQQENTDVHNIFFETAYTIRLGVMYKFQ